MAEKKLKQVCHCENCGSEAEMIITCDLLPEEDDPALEKKDIKVSNQKTDSGRKGHAVCSHCGAEADIWLDMGS